MRNLGSCRSISAYKTALIQECAKLEVSWRATSPRRAEPSPGGRRLQPIAAEDASAGAPPTTDCDNGPSPVTHNASPVRSSRRSSPSGGARLRAHDSLCGLVSGPASYGDTVLAVQDVSDGPVVPGSVSRSSDAQRGSTRYPSCGSGGT